MKRLIFCLLCLLQFGIGHLLAQKKVSGLVTGDGEPLIGATVMAKGTSTGAITDFDGLFELSVPESVTHLVFSYTGYKELEMEIGSQTYFEVTLENSQIMLNEVVITGYRKREKGIGVCRAGYLGRRSGGGSLHQCRQRSIRSRRRYADHVQQRAGRRLSGYYSWKFFHTQ